MGRFSPTVLPTAQRSFTSLLSEGFDSYLQDRDRRRAEKEHLTDREEHRTDREDARTRAGQADRDRVEDRDMARRSYETNYVERGGRYGTAPDDSGTDITIRPDPTFQSPDTAALAAGLRGDQNYQPAPAPVDGLTPDAAAWASALRGPSAAPVSAPVQQQAEPLGAEAAPMLRGGAAHPGGFDPETRTFGGTPGRAAAMQQMPPKTAQTTHLGPTGRYTQVDPGHYIDQTETPAGVRERERTQDHDTRLADDLAREGRQQSLAAQLRGEQAPVTRNTDRGIEEWDSKTRTWNPTGRKPYESPKTAVRNPVQDHIDMRTWDNAHQPPKNQQARALPSSAVEKIASLNAMEIMATHVKNALNEAMRTAPEVVDGKVVKEGKDATDATGRAAFGLVKEPGWFMNFRGKGGTEGESVRTLIGNLYATVAKERGGTALSYPEIQLLESYIPNKDDDEATAARKAGQFITTLQEIKASKIKTYEQFGYGADDEAPLGDHLEGSAPPGGGRGGGRGSRAAPAAAPSTKQTITRDQAEFLRTKKGMSDADISAQYTVRP